MTPADSIPPDAPLLGDEDIDRIVRRIVCLAIRYGGNGYREAPKDNGLKTIIIGCTVAIVSAGIIAAFTLSNQFAEFRGQVIAWQIAADKTMATNSQRIERLENRRP